MARATMKIPVAGIWMNDGNSSIVRSCDRLDGLVKSVKPVCKFVMTQMLCELDIDSNTAPATTMVFSGGVGVVVVDGEVTVGILDDIGAVDGGELHPVKIRPDIVRIAMQN